MKNHQSIYIRLVSLLGLAATVLLQSVVMYVSGLPGAHGLAFTIAIIGAIAIFILGLMLHLFVGRRLSLIRAGALRLAKGETGVSVNVHGVDELGTLARCFNEMAESIDRQQAALERSQETYARAEAITHIGSWDWDIVSGALYWTDEIYRIFGLEPQVFGATYEAFLEHVHEDDRENVIEVVNGAVSDEEVEYDIEHRVVRPNGGVRWVHERGKVYRDEAGQPIRMIGTVNDITEQKAMMQALRLREAQLDAFFTEAPAGMAIFDEHMAYKRINEKLAAQMGKPPEAHIGKTFRDVMPPELARYSEGSVGGVIRSGQPLLNQEVSGPSPIHEGGIGYWISSIFPIIDGTGTVTGAGTIVVDVTAQKKAEHELEAHRDHLEELVKARTRDLELAQEGLVRSERMATLGQLTATVGHELRNPLASMRASVFVAKKGVAKLKDDRTYDAIDRIERNIERCDHIVDELLDFSRVNVNKSDEVPLNEWINNFLDEYQFPESLIVRRDLTAPIDRVLADRHRLRRVMINVLDNACQAMELPDSEHRMKSGAELLICSELDNGKASIIVRDNGVGMSRSVIDRVFEPLFSTKAFGVGLGMPTVRQIMEQHGGGIEIESKEGEGTSVRLWLPAATHQSATRISAGAES